MRVAAISASDASVVFMHSHFGAASSATRNDLFSSARSMTAPTSKNAALRADWCFFQRVPWDGSLIEHPGPLVCTDLGPVDCGVNQGHPQWTGPAGAVGGD